VYIKFSLPYECLRYFLLACASSDLECSKLQVEYYFSDENLPTDEFLLKFVKKNKEGFGKYTI
jgi:hypothetical protein